MEEKFQQQEQPDKEKNKKSQSLTCRECGYENEPESLFCEDCGSNFNQKSRECPICGELNNGVYCEFCGINIEGCTCQNCKTLQYSSFCSECGEPLNEMAQSFLAESSVTAHMAEMTEQEAFVIMKELNDCLTPQMLKEQENKRQRIILLREREYFNEREKRIDEFYSSQKKKVKTINPQEMEILKKSIERLKGFVKEEKARVDEEIRIQDERRAEDAKKREKERYQDRASGVWIATSGQISAIMKINTNGSSISGIIHMTGLVSERIDTFKGSWDRNSISIKTVSMRTIWSLPEWCPVPVKYIATVNNNGELMNGYMDSAEYWQEIFIKE